MEVLIVGLLVLVLVVALALAVALLVVVLRRRQREADLRERAYPVDPLQATSATWDARQIKPGDVVRADGTEYVVRGTIALDEDGSVWKEHLLDASGVDGEVRRWLSVEDGESGLELAFWTRVTGADLRPDAQLSFEGVRYARDEQGTARYAATGTTGTAPSGSMAYADYVEVGGTRLLALERWSDTGSWEVSTGRRTGLESLDVLHS